MDNFQYFLDCNINKSNSDNCHENNIRDGVFYSSFLSTPADSVLDPILKARFQYIKNLCSEKPEIFEVPAQVSKYEKSLMFASFNDTENALRSLDTPFECEVIGTIAKTRTGSEINVPMLRCTNTKSQEEVEYNAENYSYDFKVQPLQYEELLYCYIKMIGIMKNEDNDTLKKFNLRAYLNRVLVKENQLNIHLLRAFYTIKAETESSFDDLEKIKDESVTVDESIFSLPITFKFDLLITLGLAYRARFFYKEAYECLLPYPLYLEKIDCLIGMRRSEEAAIQINDYINMIVSKNSNSRSDKMILCNLNIKLAHLFQDPSFFDRAFEAFRSAKPCYLKGLFYFQKKEYDLAIVSFEEALRLSPQDEKIRFSYGCSLIEVERIAEALDVFKQLKMEDPMNEKIVKNLGYCYYKQNDVENTLYSLKEAALYDSGAMNQFFILSIKNVKIENIRWALQKMSTVDLLAGGVDYIKKNGMLEESELRDILSRNPYVDAAQLNRMFT